MVQKRPREKSQLPSDIQFQKDKRQKTMEDKPKEPLQAPSSPEIGTVSRPKKPQSGKGRAVGQLRSPPPSVPPSIAPTETLYPPHADDAALRDAYDLHIVHVTPSSKIEAKVRGVLSLLKQSSITGKDQDTAKTSRPTIVALVARSPAANKCISVSEIAKRDYLKTATTKWYQYTGLWVRLEQVTVKANTHHEAIGPEKSDNDVEMEDDDYFEPVNDESRSKVRNVPCILIYLSTQPVQRFQSLYS